MTLEGYKAMRESFKARVKELIQLLYEAQVHAAHETHLREEIEHTSRTPMLASGRP